MNGQAARHFKIRGMDCAEEVAILKREVGPWPAARTACPSTS